MQVGIKIFPDRIPTIPEYSKFADFIEILASDKLRIPSLKKFKIPFTVHTTHSWWNVNPADKRLEKHNLKEVRRAQKTADAVKSDIIILHPGWIDNKHSSVENSLNFFKKLDDPRIIAENLCNKNSVAATPEGIKLFKENKINFCFDFGHAIAIAYQQKKNYKRYIRQFIKLKPVYFHISDGHVKAPKDQHMNLGEGNYDIKFLKQFINKRVVLETDHRSPVAKYKEQVELMKK
ncbi:MAG: TIM barrel protein [Candidatus Woesearchaeota archaeon]